MTDATRPCEFVALQPVAIVDHLCKVDRATQERLLRDGEIGGSSRISPDEVVHLLSTVGDFHSKAGGSAANTTRGLAAGFGVSCGIIGARGQDENGAFYASSLKRANVNVDLLRVKTSGSTARSVILTCEGQRTMRTCSEGAARLRKEEIVPSDFAGAKWALFSAYALYSDGLLPHAMKLARQAGARLALDLASFEVVRKHRMQLVKLLEDLRPDFVVCNEDEGATLLDGLEEDNSPEAALAFLSERVDIAVVTLGARGCLVRQVGQEAALEEPAASGITVVDATGAGDLFTAGFLFALMREYPLQQCARIGCLAGGAVVQSVGAELTKDNWQWLFARLHGELAAEVVRESASAVSAELLKCYALIEQLGRGVVYYGSARLTKTSAHWDRARQLGGSVAKLLGSTTWSGGGPGMMQAASLGAMDEGAPVGGIRILREAGTSIRSASYLPDDAAMFCRFLAPRKVALVDAGVRASSSDRTAYIFLPGGLGTMDELFEVLTLVQLGKLGSKHPVPIILCNYEGFYSGLMAFLKACDANGTIGAHELHNVVVAANNDEVLSALARFYGLPFESPSSATAAADLIGTTHINGRFEGLGAPSESGTLPATASLASSNPNVIDASPSIETEQSSHLQGLSVKQTK